MADAGAEAIVIETMCDLVEARLAVEAAKSTGLPVVACMVFDSGADKDRTMMGNTPEQAAAELTDAGADAIGSNCGQGIAGFLPICKRLKAAASCPIWIKGNAGLPEVVDGQTIYRQTPQEFAAYIPALVEAGAAFVGGCCGTSPGFIAAVKKVLAG
jgi:methionine synthase I (cobalamin-dependent)